jgi:hypothetical protein
MDELRRLEGKGLARAKLRAKRRRVRAIRARATVGSVALFALAWAIVFGQLVSGNDPVLNRPGRRVASIHRRSKAAPQAPVAQPEPAAESEAEEFEAAPAPEPEPAPVITSAS